MHVDRVRPFVAALGIAFVLGLATSALAPRGPTGAGQAVAVMGLGLVVGACGGYLVRSRWIVVALVFSYVLAVEVGRLGTPGPTIGVPRFDTPFGILAFVLTRVLHLVLVGLPMALGVVLLASWRPNSARAAIGHPRVGAGAVLLAGATLALAIAVALPASTPPVTDDSGARIPGSVAELTTLRIGGTDQTVMIRAADPNKPVLLYLAGGPGQSDLALARAQVTGWERHFVFVDLDQRGTGKSYASIDPVSALTLDQAVADVIDVSEYLRSRFAEPKIYLMGESWGTILGVLAVQRRPDLYYAWIGSGQMVSVLETDRRVYRDLVAYAERTEDVALASKLEEVGEPPYGDIPWANANLLTWYEYLYTPFTPSDGYLARGRDAGLDAFGVLGSEYDLIEKTNVLRGLIDTFALLYPQLYGVDLRQRVPRLEVPVYVLDGAAELEGRRSLALEWFAALEAPTKQLVSYENAAHAVAFEQGDAVQKLLTDTIVPATYAR